MRLLTLRALLCCRPEKSGNIRKLFSVLLIAVGFSTVFILFAWREKGSRLILKAAQPVGKAYSPQLENKPEEEEPVTVHQYKTTLLTRTTSTQYYVLLILVNSAPGNVDRRTFIRENWGADSAIIPRWKTFFLLGQTTDPKQSDLLLKEGKAYGDLIRADYIEDFLNNTLKIQMGFEWATRYCNFSFLLKADDDVLVIPWAVVSVLKKDSIPKNKLYMGVEYRYPPVFRGGRWGVTPEEYPRETYPPFCPGFSYVLSTDVVRVFVELFGIVPFFRLEDVYVGMLAEKAGVKVLNNRGFQLGGESCTLQGETLTRYGLSKECMAKLFLAASERRLE